MKHAVRRLTRPLAAAAVAAGCFLSVGPGAQAQSQVPQSQVPGTSTQSQNIPEQKLDAAAAAMEQVASLKESFQQRLDTAPPSDKERIADEANVALTKVVTDHGLSVEEYSAIVVMAQNDPDVRGKILQRIRPAEK